MARGSMRDRSERKASRPGGAAEAKAKRNTTRASVRVRVRVLDMAGEWGGAEVGTGDGVECGDRRSEPGAAIGSETQV